MFSSEKNSAGDVTPPFTRANPSIASWLPRMAARSCCISGGGGSRVASWQVNSNMGRTCASRVAWYSAITSSNGSASAESARWSASAHSSASRNASVMPCAVMKSLLYPASPTSAQPGPNGLRK